MAYEETPSGAHRMICDSPGCTHDCLSPGEDELKEDMALAGWVPAGEDEHGLKLFQCPGCSQGTHPGQAALNAATGGTGVFNVSTPMSVKKGDAFYAPDGNLVGHYTEDAGLGEDVGVKVQLPEPPAPLSAVEVYDGMMEGSDEDDDQHGRVSAVAPSGDVPTTGDTVVVGASSPGAQYGEPSSGERHGEGCGTDFPSEPADPEETEGLPGPQLDTDALAATAAIFDNLGATTNDWDPDA